MEKALRFGLVISLLAGIAVGLWGKHIVGHEEVIASEGALFVPAGCGVWSHANAAGREVSVTSSHTGTLLWTKETSSAYFMQRGTFSGWIKKECLRSKGAL